MLDFLLDAVTDSPSTYLVLCGVIVVDDFVPFAPGDTAMITAGILAANGGLSIYLVILAGAIGGMLGDNIFYLLGRRFGSAAQTECCAAIAGRSSTARVRLQISARGATIIFVGRFIPAGRTVTTFACGISSFPYRRFLLVDSLAALAWATYTALLGFTGGNRIPRRPVAAAIERARRGPGVGVGAPAKRDIDVGAGALPGNGGSPAR